MSGAVEHAFTHFLLAHRDLIDTAELLGDVLALEGHVDLTEALRAAVAESFAVLVNVDAILREDAA